MRLGRFDENSRLHVTGKRFSMLWVSRLSDRFFLSGAVAQLGERQVRNLEVVGSIPICSTIFLMAI